MTEIVAWVSPDDTYQTPADVLADLATVRAAFPGRTVRVAIPTAYGPYLQGAMARPTYRQLGDALCPADLAGVAALRALFEAAGYPCDGWSVPRGRLGDSLLSDRDEGAFHGSIAALFARFYWNFEAGWSGFWTEAASVQAATDWVTGYWSTAGDALGGNTGITWVTNSMLTAVPDPAKKVWLGGSNYDILEAYLPGDPNLDPQRAAAIWAATLNALAITGRPVYELVENDIAKYVSGAAPWHLWTLQATHAQALALAGGPTPVTPVYPLALPAVRRGDNVDPHNRPRDPAQIRAEGFDGVRFTMLDDAICRNYAAACKQAGLVVLGIETKDSAGFVLPVELVDVVEVGNEPDGTGPSSWTRSTDEFAADLRIYRGTFPAHVMISGGLVSGDPGYLATAAATGALDGYAGIGVHPYAKPADQAAALLARYAAVAPLPLVVSEWNRPAAEIPGFVAMLAGAARQAYWFCDGDWMVDGFGLFDAGGNQKPEYAALVGTDCAALQAQLARAQATIGALQAKITAAEAALA